MLDDSGALYNTFTLEYQDQLLSIIRDSAVSADHGVNYASERI